jgi:ABC-2 type transport system ATP-binding protein
MGLEVRDIHFSYGDIVALSGVSLSLQGGAAGLLGPNGAGKSTLLRILLGFLKPSRGNGRVLGFDILKESASIRRRIGYMPEDDCFITGMDAVSFTSYFGELSGMPRKEAMKRAHEVLFYVGLGEARYRLLDTYSAGMKQKLKLAQALVHDPQLLFLDEPTANLDPHGRSEILELIGDISGAKDIQVLISSHILADIETICSDVVILNKGRIVAQGNLQSLRSVDYNLYELKIIGNEEGFRKSLESQGSRVDVTEDGLLKIYLPAERDHMEIFRTAAGLGVQVRQFARSRTSLEDLFAQTVGVD